MTSIPRPGGNITGLMLPQLAGKRVELLRDLVPGLERVAGMHAPASRPLPFIVRWTRESEAAAQHLGLRFQVVEVQGPDGYDSAFTALRRDGVGGLTVPESPAYGRDKQQIAALALKHRLPTVFAYRQHVDAGGLVSYSANLQAMFRRAASLADKILRGTPPGQIPIEEPNTFDLVVNRTTAKALALTVPQALLLRATDVVD